MSYENDAADYEQPSRARNRPESVAKPRQEPGGPLAHRIERIDSAMAHLDNTVDRAAEVLAPVLGNERPQAALRDGSPSEEPGSDLGRFLEHLEERIRGLNDRLSYTLDRVDL